MEHMDFAALDREQYSITTDNHLADLFREFAVFRREGKSIGSDSKLFSNCRSKLTGPLLRLALAPDATSPIVGVAKVRLSGLFENNNAPSHS
jgi:hypothetical protein